MNATEELPVKRPLSLSHTSPRPSRSLTKPSRPWTSVVVARERKALESKPAKAIVAVEAVRHVRLGGGNVSSMPE